MHSMCSELQMLVGNSGGVLMVAIHTFSCVYSSLCAKMCFSEDLMAPSSCSGDLAIKLRPCTFANVHRQAGW